MKTPVNKEIASVLKRIAVYKELSGENPFKVRAFENAARSVEMHPEEVAALSDKGMLETLKGVGKGVAEVITGYVRSGRSSELETLRSAFPDTIEELFTVPGMGPKKVRAVYEKLGVSSVGELEYACTENRLVTLEGFGEKTQTKLLKAIEFIRLQGGLHLLSDALGTAEEVIGTLKNSAIRDIEIVAAGSLRRGKTTFKDIDILVVEQDGKNRESLQKTLLSLADENGVIASGDTKISVRRRGLQIDFRIVSPGSFPTALQHFTGSKEHNTILRARAKRMGLKVNEYGIYRGDEPVYVSSEEDLYKTLGLEYIPPELREGDEEVRLSEKGELPDLVKAEDFHGMVHVHSSYSDGSNSIEELARECAALGYSYLCISDHSRSAYYAHGLSEGRLGEQADEVRRVNEALSPFRMFCGIESEILGDGGLDYPDEVLEELDFIIGSVHSNLAMSKEEATERLLRAIENPYLTILGHMSGRLLLSREGYRLDEERILEALQKNGTALEHNCNPLRLDPDWPLLKRAKKMGILVSVNPDAHSIEGFSDMRYGVTMARKGWLEKKDVLNCMTAGEIDEFFKRRKKKTSV
ncbi:MAG: DNA polymerase/3'-5' exonuclease PolX [Spirochaetes bacterium]|nr:DNA polymerase/3'-5' exonuclease PolX [Spirochaetota bacterium]